MTRTSLSNAGPKVAFMAPRRPRTCPCNRCQQRRRALEALIDGDLMDQEVAGRGCDQVPTPGRFYEIQYGKGGILTTAAHAYGLGAGQARLTRAKDINGHPKNRKYWIKPTNTFERRNSPKGIISFSPIFTCGSNQRCSQPNEKKCFARIYIPPAGPPKGPRPAESDSCGVPLRTAQEEFELEVDIEELEL